jgi:hypothetical protein
VTHTSDCLQGVSDPPPPPTSPDLSHLVIQLPKLLNCSVVTAGHVPSLTTQWWRCSSNCIYPMVYKVK